MPIIEWMFTDFSVSPHLSNYVAICSAAVECRRIEVFRWAFALLEATFSSEIRKITLHNCFYTAVATNNVDIADWCFSRPGAEIDLFMHSAAVHARGTYTIGMMRWFLEHGCIDAVLLPRFVGIDVLRAFMGISDACQVLHTVKFIKGMKQFFLSREPPGYVFEVIDWLLRADGPFARSAAGDVPGNAIFLKNCREAIVTGPILLHLKVLTTNL